MKKVIGHFLVLAVCYSPVFAQRELSSSEIDTILQGLTAQPRSTWITSGTLTAEHTSYQPARITDEAQLQQLIDNEIVDYQNSTHKPEVDSTLQKMRLEAIPFNVRYENANEFTMKTLETVHYNNGRFCWSQELLSREDSIRPPLNKNFMYEYFDPQTNARKTNTWDGESFTRYDESMEFAQITKGSAAAPKVNGPLTAGLVPWGHGVFSWEQLGETDITAAETNNDGHIQIDMHIVYSTGFQLDLALDAEKAYSVMDYVLTFPAGDMIIQTYDDFVFVNNTWMPQTITIEKFDGNFVLRSRDLWSYKNISLSTPADEVFSVKPSQGASVDLSLSAVETPLRYYASYTDKSPRQVDSQTLLEQRLAVRDATGPVNCATAALKYTGAKLGRNWSDNQLSTLINAVDGTTSMYAMREYFRQQGLFCNAVKTDLKTLAILATDTQVILYLPHKNHFVVLADVDKVYVNLINLISDKFYYRVERSQFHLDWPDGAALVISNTPIALTTEIPYEELIALKGAGGYSCTYLVQEGWTDYCDGGGGSACTGYITVYFDVARCEAAESGSCTTQMVMRKRKNICFNNPLHWDDCIVDEEEWITYYMFGCYPSI